MVFRDEFNNRLAEVNKYFDFLEKIESEYKILMNHSKTLSFTIDDELLKILKANGFLILYNLIEATILNSIIAIFDEIKVDNLSYEKVSEKIKKYWFKNKYKHSDAIKDENLNNKFYILVEEVISNITLEIIKDRIEEIRHRQQLLFPELDVDRSLDLEIYGRHSCILRISALPNHVYLR